MHVNYSFLISSPERNLTFYLLSKYNQPRSKGSFQNIMEITSLIRYSCSIVLPDDCVCCSSAKIFITIADFSCHIFVFSHIRGLNSPILISQGLFDNRYCPVHAKFCDKKQDKKVRYKTQSIKKKDYTFMLCLLLKHNQRKQEAVKNIKKGSGLVQFFS